MGIHKDAQIMALRTIYQCSFRSPNISSLHILRRWAFRISRQEDKLVASQGSFSPGRGVLVRVLHVSPEGHTGLAYVDHALCTALTDIGYEVTLLTCRECPLWHIPRTYHAVPFFRGESSSKLSLALQYVWSLIRFQVYVRRLKPDVIQWEVFRIPFIDILFVRLLQLANWPVCLVVHDASPLDLDRLRRLMYPQLLRAVNHLVTFAEVSRQELVKRFGIPSCRVTTIPHGHYCDFNQVNSPKRTAEHRKALRLQPDDQVILFFGNLRPSKGLDVLLQAMPKVRRDLPRVKLFIVGKPHRDGSLNQYLATIDELELSEAVTVEARFIPDNEVGLWFELADVVVLPYLKVYSSGVIKLAYSYGVPVVASRLSGTEEVLEEGKTGYFATPGSPDDLADKLVRILSDNEKRKAMGVAAEEWARAEFDWSKTVRRLDSVYKKLSRPPVRR